MVALNGNAVDLGAVCAVEVANAPVLVGIGDLGVYAAALVAAEDDPVGGRTAERVNLSRYER